MDLFKAIEAGDIAAVEGYVKDGGDANAVNNRDYSALYWAAIMGKAKIVEVLKRAGAESDIFIESAAGDLEAVKRFLKQGADVNAVNAHGHQALMMAAHQGHSKVVKALIDVGADMEAGHSVSGNTALIGAAFQGQNEIVKILIAAKANVNAKNKNGETALSLAERQGHMKIVEALKAAGAVRS